MSGEVLPDRLAIDLAPGPRRQTGPFGRLGNVGISAHLSFETLSALADGELDQAERRVAGQHLRACERCAAELASVGRLDSALAAPMPVDCPTALSFLSAQHDRELTVDEELIADVHVAACATCRASARAWGPLDVTLAALPGAQPSHVVDQAVLALAGRTRGGRPTFGRGLVSGVAVRAAVAVALVVAVAVAGIQQPGREPASQSPESAQQPAPLPPITQRQAIVAAAQQVVLNPRTNTYFVAYPDSGKVNVVSAVDLGDIASIDVGGSPTALALNEQANTVLVLDPSQKLLSEIDASTNTLIGQTPINVAGTPTTLQVDPSSGRILIAVAEPTTAQSASPSGAVVTLNSSSKRLETTTSVAVAPRQVVFDSRGQREMLVSADVVTLVDPSTYKPLDQLPGGIAAVFAAKSDTVAILSATGTGARVSIVGDENASLALLGSPVAIVALPQGGYGVLTDETLNGRITEIGADGTPGRSVSVSLVGRELSYNAALGQFTVAGAGGIAVATITGQVALSTPAPASNAKTPGGTAATNVKPAAPPSTPSTVAVAPVVRAPERDANLPAGATLAWQGIYRLDLPDRGAPQVVGRGSGGHMWFVDSANRLTSLDAVTGQAYTISELPRDARIRSIEVGASYVYAIDVAASRVYAVSLASEKVASIALPFVKSSYAVTVTPDDVLWFAVADQILRLDPRTGAIEAAPVGHYSVGAMTADSAGRVWFSDESQKTVSLYDRRSQSVVDVSLPRKGAVTSMVVDRSGALVVGTDAGELFVVQNNTLTSSGLLGHPVVELALDSLGSAWYLTSDLRQTVLGPARSKASPRVLPSSVAGAWFDARGDAWLADRTSSGFFIAVPEAR